MIFNLAKVPLMIPPIWGVTEMSMKNTSSRSGKPSRENFRPEKFPRDNSRSGKSSRDNSRSGKSSHTNFRPWKSSGGKKQFHSGGALHDKRYASPAENTTDFAALRLLLQRHGFHFSKSMGQNFLINREIVTGIAEASGVNRSNGVVEIGPGAGILTAALSERAGKVAAVELDKTLLPVLAETLEGRGNVEIIQADALKTDFGELTTRLFPGLTPVVCANLPYQITTPVLEKLIESRCFTSLTVMVQKEVAQRLCAPEGSTQGGAFSMWLRFHAEPQYLFDVPKTCFYPVPGVDSAVMRCKIRTGPAVETSDEKLFFRVVRGGFLLRRKTLVNSLDAAFPSMDRESIRKAIQNCGFPEDVRGERLTLADFARLTDALRPFAE